MSNTALAAAVQARIKEKKLIGLTNDISDAEEVDDDRLLAACDDSLGVFVRETGITPDTDNTMHIPVLVEGVIYFLEKYVSRDSVIVTNSARSFFSALKSIREKRKILPVTNSNFERSEETSGTRPDMDRERRVFKGRRGNFSRSNFQSDNEVGG